MLCLASVQSRGVQIEDLAELLPRVTLSVWVFVKPSTHSQSNKPVHATFHRRGGTNETWQWQLAGLRHLPAKCNCSALMRQMQHADIEKSRHPRKT